jgi:hypothetical protein
MDRRQTARYSPEFEPDIVLIEPQPRGGKATPVGATGSNVRFARNPL